MKVLIVNAFDVVGGAARSAYRLYQGLNSKGIQSQMLMQKKIWIDNQLFDLDNGLKKIAAFVRPYLEYMPLKLYPRRTKTLFSSAWLPFSSFPKMIKEFNPDILHLHWIANGMVRIEDLLQIKIPIVWTMHDMWPFTGGCHNDEGCGKYLNQCGKCPVLGSKNKLDLSSFGFNRKKKVYQRIRSLNIVSPSHWLRDCAKKSSLFKERLIINIPNPIDTKIYKPMDKQLARDLLNLPKNRRMVLFGAAFLDDPNKNYSALHEALGQLNMKDIDLIVFGANRSKNIRNVNYKIHYLGQLYDDLALKIVYNASDVVVVPSIQENLSNIIIESMSCGTAVAAFHIGGNSDIIEHKINGYLVKPFDILDLANSIQWILKNMDRENLAERARQRIINYFDTDIITNQYLNLYNEILY